MWICVVQFIDGALACILRRLRVQLFLSFIQHSRAVQIGWLRSRLIRLPNELSDLVAAVVLAALQALRLVEATLAGLRFFVNQRDVALVRFPDDAVVRPVDGASRDLLSVVPPLY